MADWSRTEVEAAVADYLEMLAAELAGVPYNKASHRRKLMQLLNGRSEQSIEFKHANTSAVLIDLGLQYISGYKPRFNYQQLLYEVVAEQLAGRHGLLKLAETDADAPIVVPEVDDILSILTEPPPPREKGRTMAEPPSQRPSFSVNYLEREARNHSLGKAGEEFVLNFERARLIHEGKPRLANRVEHTSQVHGDAEGFDILSFDPSGTERLIEVKTTKYGKETPFFVSRNELAVSETRAARYFLYRLFRFRVAPEMFILDGAISKKCWLSAISYIASVR